MKIIKETEIKNINSILNKFWENSNKKIKKPNMKIILFYAQEKENILGFAYCYDLNDGYFHELILDDLFIKKEFRKKQIGKELIKEIKKYYKKNKIKKIKLN